MSAVLSAIQPADASFEAMLSTFGVMFTPDQERAAAELARVCKPGGKIGLANGTPESVIGQPFETIGRYGPPAPPRLGRCARSCTSVRQTHDGIGCRCYRTSSFATCRRDDDVRVATGGLILFEPWQLAAQPNREMPMKLKPAVFLALACARRYRFGGQ